jgi:mannose-6-phosphate isomerase-like protein (cupin superfamily)
MVFSLSSLVLTKDQRLETRDFRNSPRRHDMIKVINAESKPRTPIPEGHVRNVLAPSDDGTRVHVAVEDVDPGKTCRLAPSSRTQVVYIQEGKDAKVTHTSAGQTAEYTGQRRSGVYVEPGEEATVTASGTPLLLLLVTVPKHTGKPGANPSPAGYFFEEAQLRALVDEKRIRERTFWVNKETGLSGSWDLQLGRMYYAPQGYSPRHVHHPSKTSSVTPEHFYFIEKGTGEVKHDAGTLPIGPGSLVLIPAGEWHQLIASETGLDYIEFQAPFDFVTTMDRDPLGKNWYIKGTDDGTGKPKLWVQS